MLRIDYLLYIYVHLSGFTLQYALPAFQSAHAKGIYVKDYRYPEGSLYKFLFEDTFFMSINYCGKL